MFGSIFGKKPTSKGPVFQEPTTSSPLSHQGNGSPINRNGQTYSKVFRWRLPDGQTQEPNSVEIIGSFSHWQRIPLKRDSVLDAWHTTVHHIPGNKTHHYMLLVDGQPAYDKNCDGLAIPHGPQEVQYQLQTDKGPRVFMMFAQTK